MVLYRYLYTPTTYIKHTGDIKAHDLDDAFRRFCEIFGNVTRSHVIFTIYDE